MSPSPDSKPVPNPNPNPSAQGRSACVSVRGSQAHRTRILRAALVHERLPQPLPRLPRVLPMVDCSSHSYGARRSYWPPDRERPAPSDPERSASSAVRNRAPSNHRSMRRCRRDKSLCPCSSVWDRQQSSRSTALCGGRDGSSQWTCRHSNQDACTTPSLASCTAAGARERHRRAALRASCDSNEEGSRSAADGLRNTA